MPSIIESEITINASPSAVWKALTDPGRMKQWMGEPEMNIEISVDWQAGAPIVITGFHHVKFVNRGTVLQVEPEKILKYNYLSSISRLPDKPENYTVIGFRLTPVNDRTRLTLSLNNFPTESILKHIGFYWKTTLGILKNHVENRKSDIFR